jgi:hypothetical protein
MELIGGFSLNFLQKFCNGYSPHFDIQFFLQKYKKYNELLLGKRFLLNYCIENIHIENYIYILYIYCSKEF